MSFASQEILLSNSEFQVKVLQAMVKSALAVVGETQSGVADVDDKRHALGVAILQNPHAYVEPFRRAVVAGGLITAESDDADVEFTINSVFSDIAGVKGLPA